MAEIEPAHDAARGEPDGVALRTTEPAPPLHAAGETDPEPSADLLDRDGEPGAEPEEPDDEDRGSVGRRFIGSTPFLIFVALAVAILVKTFVIQAFYIPSESMVPTLEVGDRVFVSKFMFDGGDIARGDVIVFENPNAAELPDRSGISSVLHWLGEGVGLAQPENEDFIKRVIALPGETIEIRHDVVYIDGEPLDEPYLTQAAKDATGDYPLHTVPDDALFVMGDNRGNSADSRYGLGFVPLDKVIGKAFVLIWPPSHIGGIGSNGHLRRAPAARPGPPAVRAAGTTGRTTRPAPRSRTTPATRSAAAGTARRTPSWRGTPSRARTARASPRRARAARS